MENKTKHTAGSKCEKTVYYTGNRNSVLSQKEIHNLLHALEPDDDSASSLSVMDDADNDEDKFCTIAKSIGSCIISEKELQNLLYALKDGENNSDT